MDNDKSSPFLLYSSHSEHNDLSTRKGRKGVIYVLYVSFLIPVLTLFSFWIEIWPQKVEADFRYGDEFNGGEVNLGDNEFIVIQNNTIAATPSYNEDALNSNNEVSTTRRMDVVLTAYSSTPWETDGNPYITASGTSVRDGIVANNLLPFGTKIKIPEIFGEKIFVVEDRMNSRKGYYHIDVWLPSYIEALNFGVKTTYIEIL